MSKSIEIHVLGCAEKYQFPKSACSNLTWHSFRQHLFHSEDFPFECVSLWIPLDDKWIPVSEEGLLPEDLNKVMIVPKKRLPEEIELKYIKQYQQVSGTFVKWKKELILEESKYKLIYLDSGRGSQIFEILKPFKQISYVIVEEPFTHIAHMFRNKKPNIVIIPFDLDLPAQCQDSLSQTEMLIVPLQSKLWRTAEILSTTLIFGYREDVLCDDECVREIFRSLLSITAKEYREFLMSLKNAKSCSCLYKHSPDCSNESQPSNRSSVYSKSETSQQIESNMNQVIAVTEQNFQVKGKHRPSIDSYCSCNREEQPFVLSVKIRKKGGEYQIILNDESHLN